MPEILSHYLLHIEAINLGNFIDDTEDLSTIRGGGLMLLFLHQALVEGSEIREEKISPLFKKSHGDNLSWNLDNHPSFKLTCIANGASKLLYELVGDEAEARQAKSTIQEWLRTHPFYRFATITVEQVGLGESFEKAEAACAAGIRRSQMRFSSLSIGEINIQTSVDFCDVDRIRSGPVDLDSQAAQDPKTAYAKAPDKNWVSHSANVRRSYGRNAKLRMYAMVGQDSSCITKRPLEFVPTWDLEELTKRGGDRRDHVDTSDPIANLDGKMAVIYADGNKYGKIVSDHCGSTAQLKDLDGTLRELRRKLMLSIVNRTLEKGSERWRVAASQYAREQHFVEEQTRIETLLWGGDELIWVVPAWCGLETALHIYEHSKSWRIREDQLTQSLGLVLCSHKAPIRSVVRLAKVLAVACKDAIVDPYENDANVLGYQVLESFDSLGSDIEKSRRGQLMRGMSSKELMLRSTDLAWLTTRILDLKKEGFPKGRIHQLTTLFQQNADAIEWRNGQLSQECPYFILANRIVETMCPDRTLQSKMLQEWFLTPPPWSKTGYVSKWYHIRELWDYVPVAFKVELESLANGIILWEDQGKSV